MIQDWRPFLKKITIPEIEQQIVELKDRISQDQEEIVYLTILRRCLLAAKEFKRISNRKVEEAINTALEEANSGVLRNEEVASTDSEGKLKCNERSC